MDNQIPQPISSNISNKKLILIIVAIVVIVAVAAFFLVRSLGIFATSDEVIEQISKQVSEDVIKQVLPTVPVYNLFGAITKINNNITINVPSIMGVNLPVGSNLRVREIIISDQTKIYNQVRKSENLFNEELNQYNQKKLEGDTSVVPPSPYNMKEITKNDLKVGDILNVREKNNSDIKETLSFEAKTIIKTK